MSAQMVPYLQSTADCKQIIALSAGPIEVTVDSVAARRTSVAVSTPDPKLL